MSTNENLSGAAHDWLAYVREQVGSLRYGEIRITVHERKVTAVERTDKVRFGPQTQGADSRIHG